MSIRKRKQYKMSSCDVSCSASSSSVKEKKGDCGSGCRCVKKISIDMSIISSLLATSTRETIETTKNINNIIDNNVKGGDDEGGEYTNNKSKTVLAIESQDKSDADAVEDARVEEVNGDCEKNGYYYRNRERKLDYQKKYNKEQGDKIKNYNKDYYQKRREEILEKAKTKIICECGCEVQLFNMNSHKKTKKHARALQRVLEESRKL
jgi:hypothetical protein